MREKLIELLADSEYMSYEKKADHLIANGVTINRGTEDTPVAYNLSPTEPLTNGQQTIADRIRSMSDEELARCMLQFVIDCTVASGIENPQWDDGSEEAMIAWLKQPAEGE